MQRLPTKPHLHAPRGPPDRARRKAEAPSPGSAAEASDPRAVPQLTEEDYGCQDLPIAAQPPPGGPPCWGNPSSVSTSIIRHRVASAPSSHHAHAALPALEAGDDGPEAQTKLSAQGRQHRLYHIARRQPQPAIPRLTSGVCGWHTNKGCHQGPQTAPLKGCRRPQSHHRLVHQTILCPVVWRLQTTAPPAPAGRKKTTAGLQNETLWRRSQAVAGQKRPDELQ
mmetsp:Transcript_46528/g.92494  ORF Transcript_46528/g.92494 Transcript_46528/m.92494 type:complete len:224 (+) Transcript_46528:856-1527(+)